jgi:hypothetical protein
MKRLHIDRIDLHLRNVPAATAGDAARLLGPALTRALANRTVTAEGGSDVDAGRLQVAGEPGAPALADGIASRIATKTSRG